MPLRLVRTLTPKNKYFSPMYSEIINHEYYKYYAFNIFDSTKSFALGISTKNSLGQQHEMPTSFAWSAIFEQNIKNWDNLSIKTAAVLILNASDGIINMASN